MDCLAYCTAGSYLTKSLYESVRTRFKAALYRDVVHIEIPTPEGTGDLFCFPYGSCVFWGIPQDQTLTFLQELTTYEEGKLAEIETDEFTFIYGDTAKVAQDEIVLPNHEAMTKLAFSHGLAQSVKLGTFETRTLKTFNNARHIPQDLAKEGKIPLSRKEIRRKMGELFVERSSINLHVDVLDEPEIFWEYPELEPYYMMIANYLDVQTRVEVLNKRLEIIHELFEVLGNELNHQHSSRLEWTIILLIVIEVIISLVREVNHAPFG